MFVRVRRGYYGGLFRNKEIQLDDEKTRIRRVAEALITLVALKLFKVAMDGLYVPLQMLLQRKCFRAVRTLENFKGLPGCRFCFVLADAAHDGFSCPRRFVVVQYSDHWLDYRHLAILGEARSIITAVNRKLRELRLKCVTETRSSIQWQIGENTYARTVSSFGIRNSSDICTEKVCRCYKQQRVTRKIKPLARASIHFSRFTVISLAEGMPNEEMFPFTEMTIKLNDGTDFVLEGEELGAALQYIPSQGYPPLLQIAPHEPEFILIDEDEEGMSAINLRQRLEERVAAGLTMPKLMYINPTGNNPTGTVMSLERRLDIYKIACEYNFLILDDDPYHFLYFTDVSAPRIFYTGSCTISSRNFGK
ncbi:unnamed protein product [Trichogramma brassicae]|uniref:Aminotransferase class I/classII domain-containing protein n=1 Tax=Trichogramma brassicae TaxID=86971 RepID=A0A6H5JAR8_9HYME|nr:unnamed protein product [Trichogramma brassicae]